MSCFMARRTKKNKKLAAVVVVVNVRAKVLSSKDLES